MNLAHKFKTKIVIATNMTETSIIIDDVVLVVDTWKMKMKFYINLAHISKDSKL